MYDGGNVQVNRRTGKTASIWLALFAALCFHVSIIFLPVEKAMKVDAPTDAHIELELTVFSETPEPEEAEAETEAEADPPEIVAESVQPPETGPQSPKRVVEQLPAPLPVEPSTPEVASATPAQEPDQSLEAMSAQEKSRLTNAILIRQYISEESVAEQIFGRPAVRQNSRTQEGFHYPVRQSMITMLDQPMPDLPFAYTPDLVHFAYDPGVKGDLQRFWDVITPEWGFRTKYGTEVRCIWILVFAGCAWK